VSEPILGYCEHCEEAQYIYICECLRFVCEKCWDSVCGICRRCSDGPSDDAMYDHLASDDAHRSEIARRLK